MISLFSSNTDLPRNYIIPNQVSKVNILKFYLPQDTFAIFKTENADLRDFIPKDSVGLQSCSPFLLMSGSCHPSKWDLSYHLPLFSSRRPLKALHKNGHGVPVFNPETVCQTRESVCTCPLLLFCLCILSWLSSRAFDFHTSMGVSGLLFSLLLCLQRSVSNSTHNERITTTRITNVMMHYALIK